MPSDFYQTLGVSRSASADEIKRAYRKLAHQYHPDKGGNEAKFKDVNEAYQVLGDDQKKQQYDQFGSAFEGGGSRGQGEGFGPFGAGGFNVNMDDLGDIGDVFSQFFGGQSPFGGSRTNARGRERGEDLQVNISIPFAEMVFGAKREFPLNRHRTCPRCHGNQAEPGTKIETCATCKGSGTTQQHIRTMLGTMVQRTVCATCKGQGKIPEKPCTECHGEGRTRQMDTLIIPIPAGIEDGMRIRIRGEGEAPRGGGDVGDLYVFVNVRTHPSISRDGHNLRSNANIPFTVAALGGTVSVETVEGEEHLDVPHGTPSGAELKLKGKGIVHGQSEKRGDHVVTVSIDVPKKLTKTQEDLLKEFAELGKMPKKRLGFF